MITLHKIYTVDLGTVKVSGTVEAIRDVAEKLGKVLHYSTTKDEFISIPDMATPYLRNAINKFLREEYARDIDLYQEFIAMVAEYAAREDR